MEGALHGFTDPVRQMDICCIDGGAGILVDADDAIERMLALFGFLLMAHQVNHLLNLLPSEVAVQFDDAGRKFVVDAPAGRTKRLVALLGSRRPLPAPVMIDGAALRANRAVV